MPEANRHCLYPTWLMVARSLIRQARTDKPEEDELASYNPAGVA